MAAFFAIFADPNPGPLASSPFGMVHRLRNFLFATPTRKRLLGNLFNLSLMQAVSNLVHIITIPHFISVCGMEGYGKIGLAYSTAYYLVTLCEFGFQFSAVKEVSINRDKPDMLSHIISRVYSAKMLLLLLSGIILAALIALYPMFRSEAPTFAWTFLFVAAQALYPTWFLQGVERIRLFSWLNVGARFGYLLLAYLLIRQPEDYWMAHLLNGLCFLLVAGIGIWQMSRIPGLRYFWPGWKACWQTLRDSAHAFVSSFAHYTLSNSNLNILGLFASYEVIGHFSVAERLISGLRQFTSILFQSSYPNASRLYQESQSKLVAYLQSVRRVGLGVYAAVVLGVMLLADWMVYFLNRFSFDPEAAFYLRVGIWVLPVLALGIKANQLLLVHNRRLAYIRAYGVAAVLGVALNLGLTWQLGALGTALAMSLSEALASGMLIGYDVKYLSKTL